MTTIYEFGYRGLPQEQLVAWLEKHPKAVIVDVRFGFLHPGNIWSQTKMRNAFSKKYLHVRELGNKAYKEGGRIEIADMETGIERLMALLEEGKEPALMCACADFDTCHRKTVIDELERRKFEFERKTIGDARPALFGAPPKKTTKRTS